MTYSAVSEYGAARLGVLLIEDAVWRSGLGPKVAEAKVVPVNSASAVLIRVDSATMLADWAFDVKVLRKGFTPVGELRPCSVIHTVKVCVPIPVVSTSTVLVRRFGSVSGGVPKPVAENMKSPIVVGPIVAEPLPVTTVMGEPPSSATAMLIRSACAGTAHRTAQATRATVPNFIFIVFIKNPCSKICHVLTSRQTARYWHKSGHSPMSRMSLILKWILLRCDWQWRKRSKGLRRDPVIDGPVRLINIFKLNELESPKWCRCTTVRILYKLLL